MQTATGVLFLNLFFFILGAKGKQGRIRKVICYIPTSGQQQILEQDVVCTLKPTILFTDQPSYVKYIHEAAGKKTKQTKHQEIHRASIVGICTAAKF